MLELLITLVVGVAILLYFGLRKYILSAVVWWGTSGILLWRNNKDTTSLVILLAVVVPLIAFYTFLTIQRRRLLRLYQEQSEYLEANFRWMPPWDIDARKAYLEIIKNRLESLG